ncbi:hypothetical protein B0T22DRAFT_142035 [Podospora appendiculata]|uniref:Uncharacterized protein n=1 Tax=Podospora appendiculata TaxID=314037 RepID=A0AAE1CC06_9PEZI|nr:hypothetical protein B0T22DRAFT_142035 [Podospora appendiculata]
MECGGLRTLICPTLANLTELNPDFLDDGDGENAAANAVPMRRRWGSGQTSSAIYGPFWDIAERISPREPTRTDNLEPRNTGASRRPKITPESGVPYETQTSEYITGHGGRDLNAVNPNAGYFTLEDEQNCLSAVIVNSGTPANDQSAEHLPELANMAMLLQFMQTGRADGTTQTDPYETRFRPRVVPERIFGQHSVFRQSWRSWDLAAPPGMHPNPDLSAERDFWDLVGSLVHPEFMVNLQQFLNAFKSCILRGIAAISEARWTRNHWDDTSEASGFDRALEALSELRNYPAVFSYLNHPDVHRPFYKPSQRDQSFF